MDSPENDDFAEDRNVLLIVGCLEDPKNPNIKCVDAHKPGTKSDTPSMYVKLTVNSDIGEVKDQISAIMGRRSDANYAQFSDPSLYEVFLVSSATHNISKSGIAANGIRQIINPLPENWVVKAGVTSGITSKKVEYLQLAIVLKESKEGLGGGKKSLAPTKGGGSQALGNLMTFKSEFVSQMVIDWRAEKSDLPSILKKVIVTGNNRQVRQNVMVAVVEKGIASAVENLETAKGTLPPKLQVFEQLKASLGELDLNDLPSGATQRKRKSVSDHNKKASDEREEEGNGELEPAQAARGNTAPSFPQPPAQPKWKEEIVTLRDLAKDGYITVSQCEEGIQAILEREGMASKK